MATTLSPSGTLVARPKKVGLSERQKSAILDFLTKRKTSLLEMLSAMQQALKTVPKEIQKAMDGQMIYWRNYESALNDLISIAQRTTVIEVQEDQNGKAACQVPQETSEKQSTKG